tara:strand:+ start:334 stop:1986 length:1653 start_codon:yes stop_codon:yes gene_type:complete
MGFKGAKQQGLDYYERTRFDINSFELLNGRFGEAGQMRDKLVTGQQGFLKQTEESTAALKKEVLNLRKSGTPITEEVREGLKVKHNLTSTNLVKKIRRSLGSLMSVQPELVGDFMEKLLSGNYTDKEIHGAWRTFHETIEQMENDGFKVGHHGISLSLVREPLSQLPLKVGNQVLDILEKQYGYKFGEAGMEFVSPLAHESAQIGKVRKPGSYKTGLRLDHQVGLAKNGKPIASIDEVNPNLRSILEPRMAHAERFGGNKGFGAQALEAIKGETNAAKIAAKLQPFIEAEMAGTRQGLETTKIIMRDGFKDGKFVPNNWKEGGKLEKSLNKVELYKPSKELVIDKNRLNQTKVNKKPNTLSSKYSMFENEPLNSFDLDASEVDLKAAKVAGGLRRSEALGNVVVGAATGNVAQTVAGGAGVIMSDEKVQKRIAKEIAKLTAERTGKTAAKFVPGLDVGISAAEAYGYAATGNYGQAAVAALSGAVGWVPGWGDATSAALDTWNFGKDTQKIYKQYKKGGLNADFGKVDIDLDDIAEFDGKPSRRWMKSIL